MFFTSVEFILFFVALLLLWTVAGKRRPELMVLASLFFLSSFSWTAAFVCLALALLNFSIAHILKSRIVYVVAQSVNALSIPLAAWATSGNYFFDPVGGYGQTWLTIGLSFYNLQHIAYLADVWKRRIAPESNAALYLLGASYFPKVLSGPIILYQQFRPQLENMQDLKPAFASGFNRLLLGYFKKVVLADGLAPGVSSVFDHNDELPGLTILTAAVLFTLQLYFDFSGYCDVAIGCSRILGINLPENFNFPFRAGSMADFWRRWHITLLGFFNQYVFLPLAFRLRRWRKHGTAAGIAVVFLSSALWHGIGATFILWGLTHGCYMLVEHYNRKRISLPRVLGSFIVLILFSFSNIFFRSPGLNACLQKVQLLFTDFMPGEWYVEFLAPMAVGGHLQDLFNFYVVIVICAVFLVAEKRLFEMAEQQRVRIVFSYVILLLIFMFGVFGSSNRFIYMQF